MDKLLAYGSDEGSDEDLAPDVNDRPRSSKRPSLPAPLVGSNTSESLNEDSANHKGKIRSFPHVEGNYPSHIYIPPPKSHTLYELAHQLMISQSVALEPYEGEMHLSLSRPFALRQMQITLFAEALRSSFRRARKFYVEVVGWKYFVNEEKTRSFFTLTINSGKLQIIEFIAEVDSTMKDFGLPPYYNNPEPHITIGWVLGDVLPSLPATEGQLSSPCTVEVSRAECKIGKYIYEYAFV